MVSTVVLSTTNLHSVGSGVYGSGDGEVYTVPTCRAIHESLPGDVNEARPTARAQRAFKREVSGSSLRCEPDGPSRSSSRTRQAVCNIAASRIKVAASCPTHAQGKVGALRNEPRGRQ